MKIILNMAFIILYLCITNILAQTTQTEIPWATLADSPWPMISHDPQFTGRSPFKGPQTPNVIWTRDYTNGIFSGPVIGEKGNLYFGSYYQLDSADKFYSITPTGEDRWIFDSGSNRPPQTGIVIDSSNTIYFGSLDRHVYALNSDGSLKWKYETSSIIFEIVVPNIDLEGRIYTTNGLGELYSINPDGTLNWKVKHDDGFFLKSPVFSPDGNTIYIAGSDSNLYALNLDGSIKWKFNCGLIRKFPSIDSDGNLHILPEMVPQKLFSLNSNGEVRWSSVIVDSFAIKSHSAPCIDIQGNIYIALGSAIFSYSNNGILNWYYIIGSNPDEYDEFWQPLICDVEGTVYVGSTFGKYYYAISKEGELKWKLPLNEYQVDNTGAIAEDGTLYIGVHKSSLFNGSERNLIAIRDTITTGIFENRNEIPKKFLLEQNYPNPFNPSTIIKYSIPSNTVPLSRVNESNVTLKVFDILGKEVAILVNELQTPGSYQVKWNAEDLSSGIYFYQIKVNGWSDIKKMILLR